jgi:hypothetical protein
MKFHLIGEVCWVVGSCHDDRCKEINEEFEAPNEIVALKKAKTIIREYHKTYGHRTDYGLEAELRIVKPIWKIIFHDDKPAQSAILAQPACSAIPAHFEEKLLS